MGCGFYAVFAVAVVVVHVFADGCDPGRRHAKIYGGVVAGCVCWSYFLPENFFTDHTRWDAMEYARLYGTALEYDTTIPKLCTCGASCGYNEAASRPCVPLT